jgi:hypothetical protein
VFLARRHFRSFLQVLAGELLALGVAIVAGQLG